MDEDPTRATDTVAAMLAAAGLNVPDADLAALSAVYPAVRRRMARIHAVDTGDRLPWTGP